MMNERKGTPVWKIVLGVFLGFVAVGVCVAGGCVALVWRQAQRQAYQEEYVSNMSAKIEDADIGPGYLKLSGSITNHGDRVVRYWKVSVKFLDSRGAVIDSGYTNSIHRLGPNESQAFQIRTRDTGAASRSDAVVEEVRLD